MSSAVSRSAAPATDGHVGYFGPVSTGNFIPTIVLGIFCAGAGVLTVQGLAFVEEVACKSAVLLWRMMTKIAYSCETPSVCCKSNRLRDRAFMF
jgi:hypothetical protein